MTLPRLNFASLTNALLATGAALFCTNVKAELVVHFDPGLLSHQFSDSDFGGGTIPAQIGDRAGFVTDARSLTPGAPSDGFIDTQNNGAPIITPHATQGSVWNFDGTQNLLTVTDLVNQNANGFGTLFDVNTITAVIAGRIDAAGTNNRYLFDFRDDAPTGGGSNTANGFALRYNHNTGMLEGLAKQTVNASVPLPIGEWFVATYAWDGGNASATISVDTLTGYTANNTSEAATANLDPDQFRLGSATVGSGERLFGSMGQVYFYNDIDDHSAVAAQLASDYFAVPELVIDRETGNISIVNSMTTSLSKVAGYQMSSPIGALDPEQWLSIADNYDASAPPANRRDPNNNWTKLTIDPTTRDDLSEAEFESNGGANNGATFLAGSTTSLGNAWIRYYQEDVTMELLFDDGSTAVLDVRYEGNGGNSFAFGDLNFDGTVDEDDFYQAFLPNYGDSTSALSSGPEKYGLGDMNEDGTINLTDFLLLNNAYRAANPLGPVLSFSGVQVPEPSTYLMLVAGVMGTILCRHRNARGMVTHAPALKTAVPVLFLAVLFGASRASADLVVHLDPNVLASMFSDGGTGGGSIAAEVGDTVGFISDVRATSYGAAGAGDGWHDLEGSATNTSARPQIVAHDTLGTVWSTTGGQTLLGRPTNSGNTDGHGATTFNTNTITAIVAGRASSAGAGQDYLFDFRDDTATGGGANANDGFALRYDHTSGLLEGLAKQTVNASIAVPQDDWFVAMYVWNGLASSATLTIETMSGVTGTNTATALNTTLETDRWRPANVAAGGTAVGWHGLMGDLLLYNDVVDHSDVFAQLVEDYTTFPTMELTVNRTNGEITLMNTSGQSFIVDAYTIASEMNSLNPTGWNSLDDQSFDGNAWTQLDASVGLVSEGAFSLTGTTIATGTSVSLGNLFDTNVAVEDLAFSFHIAGTSPTEFLAGDVSYFDGPGGVQGDFNNDGIVNLADYTVWRDNLGGNESALNGNGSGNATVGAEDYDLWKAHFGTSSGGGPIAAANVPEPRAALLLGILLAGVAMLRGRQTLRVPCRVLALVGVASIATSASALTLDDVKDRHYTMGDYNDGSLVELGTPGGAVGSNYSQSGHDVLDSFGTDFVTFADFDDLAKSGDPRYHQIAAGDVSNGYLTGNVGSFGISFNAATSDHLINDETVNNLPTTGQGVQFWTKPSAAGLATGLRQSLVFDTNNFGGPAITESGHWTMTNSAHANETDIATYVPVVADKWVHVNQQVYLRGESHFPALVPGSPNANEWSAVLYIDGVAVAANNDSNASTIAGSFVIGADDLGGTVGHFYSGIIDEVKVYVQDPNEFSLLRDNEFIATSINDSYVAAGKAPGTPYQPGDLNLDGDVDLDDVPLFVAGWKNEKVLVGAHRTMYVGDFETLQWGDYNLDGKVDIRDAGILHVALKNAGFAGLDFALLESNTVPEPSTCTLLAVGALLLIAKCRPSRGGRVLQLD